MARTNEKLDVNSLALSSKLLRVWFDVAKRKFPWRENPSAYEVLVSEVMLQQTRAIVVIPYFKKWIKRFPKICDLAKSSEEEVVKLWEGLGYYRRARNLLEAAKQIVREFQGKIPSEPTHLKAIQGIGDYTMGAVLAFGFKKRSVAIDGNATRVLTRFFLIEKDICKSSTKKEIAACAYRLLGEKEPSKTMEAIIELGATICLPRPKCLVCPLKEHCLAYQKKKMFCLPIKKQREKAVHLKRAVLVVESAKRFLICQEKENLLMSGLYQFPFFDFKEDFLTISRLKKWVEKEFSFEIKSILPMQQLKQFFTKYKVDLFPFHIHVKQQKEVSKFMWFPKEKLKKLPFCSGHRKILKEIER